MTNRQRIILRLIERAGGRIEKLRLVKLSFLLSRPPWVRYIDDFYAFVPYRHGPFSFALYYDLGLLARDGVVQDVSDSEILLRKSPSSAVPGRQGGAIDALWAAYGDLTTTRLVDAVYEAHPWFTMNAENSARRAVTRPVADPAVYTAGFGGQEIDGILNLLLRTGIGTLVDVRRNPTSRRYGFHKNTLSRLCGLVGVGYEHLPELGVPSDWRGNLRTARDYRDLFAKYEEAVLGDPATGMVLNALGERMRQVPSVLTCQEADPACCHRSPLADRLAQLSRLPVAHLRVGTDG